jgi:cytochrome oxidase Cu insertion factor (SCO1/SenC/PrrC family)
MRTAVLLAITLLSGSVTTAQPGGGLPAPGSLLPDVVVYDEDGREFSLTELRGEYAVLVFGCLT